MKEARQKASQSSEPSAQSIQEQVGLTAGSVWHSLSQEGPQTVADLKRRLNGASDVLSFALGWLAREDKILITPERKTFRVALK